MRTKLKIIHAKQRLKERFNLEKLPNLGKIFIKSLSNNRKLYKYKNTEIYFIWRKSDKQIITFLTKEQCINSHFLETKEHTVKDNLQ